MKYRIIRLALGALFFMASCEKGLTPEVFTKLASDNFLQTAEDVEVYVNGIYGEFRGTGAYRRYSTDPYSRIAMGEWGADECWDNIAWQNNPQRNFTFTVNDFWNNFYTEMVPAVTKATAAIPTLKNSPINEELKQRYIAEVKCCRALWMYDLEKFFGPPYVVLDEDAALSPNEVYFPPRLSDTEYLAFLETDLLSAKENLPEKYDAADYGRFTKGAALTILLKLYMLHKEWSKAITISEEIMSLGVYALESDYAKIWDINNEQNSEIIFALGCISQPGVNVNMMRTTAIPPDWVSPNGYPAVKANAYRLPWEIWDQFDPMDERRKTMVKDYYIQDKSGIKLIDGRATGRLKTGAMPLKYSEDPNSDGKSSGNDIVVFRYADVLLLRAEALNEVNGPNKESIDLINEIRTRAFKNPQKLVKITDFSSKDQLRDYLLKERLFEFCWEGERRTDLIRHGKFIEFARARGATNAQPFHVRYPLPMWAIIEGEGTVTQNPGY